MNTGNAEQQPEAFPGLYSANMGAHQFQHW